MRTQSDTTAGHDHDTLTGAVLPVGTAVEVRSRFDRRWAGGFSVAAVARDAYQLRRTSDGSVLPAWFPSDDIRRTVALP